MAVKKVGMTLDCEKYGILLYDLLKDTVLPLKTITDQERFVVEKILMALRPCMGLPLNERTMEEEFLL